MTPSMACSFCGPPTPSHPSTFQLPPDDPPAGTGVASLVSGAYGGPDARGWTHDKLGSFWQIALCCPANRRPPQGLYLGSYGDQDLSNADATPTYNPSFPIPCDRNVSSLLRYIDTGGRQQLGFFSLVRSPAGWTCAWRKCQAMGCSRVSLRFLLAVNPRADESLITPPRRFQAPDQLKLSKDFFLCSLYFLPPPPTVLVCLPCPEIAYSSPIKR